MIAASPKQTAGRQTLNQTLGISPWKALFIPLFGIILSSCAVKPASPIPGDTNQAWLNHRQQLTSLNNWVLDGRTAIKNSDNNISASLNWSNSTDRAAIQLSGPFGQGAVKLTLTLSGAELHLSDGTILQHSNPEQLVRSQLGVTLPVQDIPFWIKGLPSPNGTQINTVLNQHGYLQSLEQNGWHIQFERYATFQNLDLPTKIFAKNQQQSVRIIIHDWSFPNTPP